MNKTAKYAKYGALFGALCNLSLNLINQLKEIERKPDQNLDLKRLLFAGLKGGAGGALLGAGIGAMADYQNSRITRVNTDSLLLALVQEVRLDKGSRKYTRISNRADEICELLWKYYGQRLAKPIERFGSTERNTALKSDFDIDLALTFSANAFLNLDTMFYDVLSFLENNLVDARLEGIREQRKSIGILYEIGGERHRIDVALVQLTKKRGNRSSGYMFKNDVSGSSYTKTDIAALKNVKLSPTQQKIVVLMKHWKVKYDVPLSSHLLERLVIDAYERLYVPRNFTSKVIMVFEHIAERLDVIVIKGVENSNNVISNIPKDKKEKIMRSCKKVLEEYRYQPNSILEFLD